MSDQDLTHVVPPQFESERLKAILAAILTNNPVITKNLLPAMIMGPAPVWTSVALPGAMKDELISFLKGQPAFDFLNGGMLNFGNSAMQVKLLDLADWLIVESKSKGVDVVVQNLEEYLKLEDVPGYDVLLISGLKINSSIKLDGDVELKPLSMIKGMVGADPLHAILAMVHETPQPTAALLCPSNGGQKYRHEKFSGQPRRYVPRLNELIDACWCLALVKPLAPLPFSWAWIPADWVPLSGKTLTNWQPLGYEHGKYTYRELTSQQDIARAREMHGVFAKLPEAARDKARIPLTRLNAAIRRGSLVNKAIELGIALEAILLPTKTAEIASQFRLRGAWLLGGDDFEKRQKIFNDLKMLYEIRSSAVHEGRLPRKTTQGRQIGELLEVGFCYGIEALEALMRRNFNIDWDSLILGKSI